MIPISDILPHITAHNQTIAFASFANMSSESRKFAKQRKEINEILKSLPNGIGGTYDTINQIRPHSYNIRMAYENDKGAHLNPNYNPTSLVESKFFTVRWSNYNDSAPVHANKLHLICKTSSKAGKFLALKNATAAEIKTIEDIIAPLKNVSSLMVFKVEEFLCQNPRNRDITVDNRFPICLVPISSLYVKQTKSFSKVMPFVV